jgi:acyl carrier protein
MPSDQALGILGDILTRASMTQIAIASVDWNVLKPVYEARRRHPLLEYMVDDPVQTSLKEISAQAPSLVASLETALPEDRLSIILEQVAGSAAAVLGAARPDMLDIYQGLFDMGMDSLMSVELKTRLEKSIGRSLPSTLTFNYPTIAELADYLLSKLFPVDNVVQASQEVEIEEIVPIEEDEMDDFSEDELADLLMKKLKGLQ